MENDRERRFLKVGTCLTHFLPRFQLRDLPRGTRILADGNSFFAERMVTLLCGCRIDHYLLETARVSNRAGKG